MGFKCKMMQEHIYNSYVQVIFETGFRFVDGSQF